MPKPRPKNRRLSGEIRRLAARLSDPENYLTGYSPKDALDIPVGILCFCRRDAPLLLRRSSRFHRDHHHRHVLICALHGSGEICIDNQFERLEPGSAFFIAPYQFHHYRWFSARKITWLFLTFELRSDALVHSLGGRGAFQLDSADLPLLHQILQAWKSDRQSARLPLLLGAFLLGLRGKKRHARHEEKSPLPHSELLREINTLVLKKECFPLKELAATLHMSASNLRARFRNATGLSLGSHIRYLRIQKACSLLATSSLRIHQVAEACRYNSVYAFSRSFRVSVGVSPSRFRSHQQKYARRHEEQE